MSDKAQKTFDIWKEYADNSLQEELDSMSEDDIKECFTTSLSFGTAGLRGFLRAGTNGMNIHTVAQATQGLANYVNKNFDQPSVAIARDSRHKGQEFVEVCVGVLAANGIVAYFHEDPESTPGLSFTTRYFNCSAGICITASHNPAEYNGYKAYGPDGCQITTEAANAISSEIAKTDIFEDVKILNFKDACSGEYAKKCGPEVREAFIAASCATSVVPTEQEDPQAHKKALEDASNLKLAYTALNGTGYAEVMPALERNGFTDIVVVEKQANPDGSFPTCTYPNPETEAAMALGVQTAADNNCDICCATDPDADRCGVAVRHNGQYVRLNGNEIGVLLFNYLCEARKAKGDNLNDLVCVTTIVSSDIVDEIAKHYGVELRRTLTGFKYIGEQILHLEQAGVKERFMFGFEESCGYLAGTHVRDKDAICGTLLISQMAAMYKAQGKDLMEVLEELYQKFGYYKNEQVSVEYPGLEGQDKMAEVLSGIRSNNPTVFAGLKVVGSTDYNNDTKMTVIGDRKDAPDELLPASNVLEFPLEGGSKIIVRPSGTEPKIKVYCFARANTEKECADIMDNLKTSAKELLA